MPIVTAELHALTMREAATDLERGPARRRLTNALVETGRIEDVATADVAAAIADVAAMLRDEARQLEEGKALRNQAAPPRCICPCHRPGADVDRSTGLHREAIQWAFDATFNARPRDFDVDGPFAHWLNTLAALADAFVRAGGDIAWLKHKYDGRDGFTLRPPKDRR